MGQAHALILDFDGVIVDSEGMQLCAVNHVLTAYGVELSSETWAERCVGRKARDFLHEFLGYRVDGAEFERLLVAKSQMYRQLARESVPVARPGIVMLLDAARARGFRCGVASATPEADIRDVTERLGIVGMLQAIVSSDAVARPKPAPDVYLRAAELLGVAPAGCVVVEDTPTGLQAGRAAGMRCVAFPNAWTAAFDFSGADLIVPALDPPAIDRILDLAVV